MSERLKASELKLGDVVRLFDYGYGIGTVKQIKDGQITFFRPYVSTGDFTCTSGVICYIGIEQFTRSITENVTYEVLYRSGNRWTQSQEQNSGFNKTEDNHINSALTEHGVLGGRGL